MKGLNDLYSGLSRFRWRVVTSLLLGALTIAAGTGLIAASGYLISWAALRPPILDMILVLVAVRFFGISRAVFRYAERLFSHDLTFRILQQLRIQFYHKIEPLLPTRVIRLRSADLLNRFSDDVDQLQEFYLKTAAPTATALLFILVTTLILSIYSVALGVAAFILMVIHGFIMPFLIKYKAGRSAEEKSGKSAELGQFMADHIRGRSDLIFSGHHRSWMENGEKLVDELAGIQRKRAGAFGLESGFYTLASHMSIPISFLILLPLVLDGAVSGLMMTAIVLGLFSVFEALEPMGNALQHYAESREAGRRLQNVTSNPDGHEEYHKKTRFEPGESSIRFQNVTFGYENTPVLNNLTMGVRPGEYVILKGASGCGKSTMAHLLVKWFEPWQGDIFIGGHCIGEFRGAEVRKQISVVGQHTRLFNTSLRNNLKIAKPDATDEELAKVLEKVRFSRTLQALPDGLSTQVGELGLRLSGGERQRVSLARALLKDAPIWILDEPLSSLDRKTADEVLNTIHEVARERTILHITHQNRRLMDADRIFVISKGRVSEWGTGLSNTRAG